MAAPQPAVAVVIPVHRQPGLMVEAVGSVLAQKADFAIATVIVDDGCPLPETSVVGASIAMAHPSVTYLRKDNGGLSSARNHGIAHVLSEMPSVEAIQFLDADNRLAAGAIAGSLALLRARPDAAWVYPQINRFGLRSTQNHVAPYSRLLHIAFDNICEAGSLVSRRIFGRGLRFDESFTRGLEDWDFWLQCLGHGFRGVPNPFSGFEYRQRPQSMVAGTKLDFARVREDLRAKHPLLNSYATLIAIEHEEAPRHAVICPRNGAARLFSDPGAPGRCVDRDTLLRLVRAEMIEPDSAGPPPNLMLMPDETLGEIQRLGLAWSLFNLIEKQLAAFAFIAITFDDHASELGFRFEACGLETALIAPLHGLALTSTRLQQMARDGVPPPAEKPEGMRIVLKRMAGGQPCPKPFLAGAALRLMVAALKDAPRQRWNWRSAYYPTMPERAKLLGKHLGLEAPLSRLPRPGRPQIGFALPLVASGGVERVAFALAREIAAAGCDAHLFIFAQTAMPVDAGLPHPFASVNFFCEPGYKAWGGKQRYLGEPVRLPEEAEARVPAVCGFLAGMDVVVNAHVPALHAAAGALRRAGTRLIDHVHVLDRSAHGRSQGVPFGTLAHEHGLDAIFACSEQIASWLRGMGVPGTKVITVPNAPTHQPAQRQPRATEGFLKALFLGRLDNQKGIERLIALVRESGRRGLPVEWRIIGSPVLDGAMATHLPTALQAAGAIYEPAIRDVGAVAQALAKADILVLPSRWEGAPLVVPEAQQAGCVPIATDVGALSELIRAGEDGLLVADGDDDAVVPGFLAQIEDLLTNPAKLAEIGAEAQRRAARRSWSQSSTGAIALLRSWFLEMH
jgi:glycosyltransferase involved in cell wall biosynthesis